MRIWAIAALLCACAGAVVVDRIAVVAGTRAIKDSDIAREIRVVSFLNNTPADMTAKARRDAAQRLIDQTIIARDVEIGRYPTADPAEVNKLLAQVRARYGAGYARALQQHQVTEEDVRAALAWQITVLHYIERRFHGTPPTPEQVSSYFHAHRRELGSATLEQARSKVENVLRGETVNNEFFGWLERSRKEMNIRYLEDELR